MTVRRYAWRTLAVVGVAIVGSLGSFGADLVFGGSDAWAQTRVRENRSTFADKSSKFRGRKISTGLEGLGYEVGDGIIVSPTIAIEGGHDTNPDQLFNGVESSYGLVDGGLAIGVSGSNSATKATVRGSYVNYPDLQRDGRWDFGASFDTIYQVHPGLFVSGGASYQRDALELTEDQSKAGYAQVDYVTEELQSFVKARAIEVKYLTEVDIAKTVKPSIVPFLRNKRLNAMRRELTLGALYGRNRRIGVYGEVGIADADYFDQFDESVVDRDAEEYYAVVGARLTFSPWLRADIGYRFNHRDLEDPKISSYETSYFDGSLIWAPRPNFSISAEVDRKIGEPGSAFSRVADITRFALAMHYKPSSRSLLKVQLQDERIREIGDLFTFHERSVAAEYSYDVSRAVQLYAGVLAERVSEDALENDSERYRFGAGARVRLGVPDPVAVEHGSLKDDVVIDDVAGVAIHRRGGLAVSLGYSHLDLPKIRMMSRVGGGFFDEVIGRIVDHKGDVDGYRVDAKLNDFASHTFSNGLQTNFSLTSFYSHYDGEDKSSCSFTVDEDCAFTNIVDFDEEYENNTGPFGQFEVRTKRNVDYWGVGIEARLGQHGLGGSLKDSIPSFRELPIKLGIAMRALQQDVDLFAIDVSVPDPVDYDEALDTYYWGGYIGLEHTHEFAAGLSLTLDAHAGVYYARTNYNATYEAFVPIGGSAFIIERSKLEINDESSALIAGVNVGLEKDVGWATLGVFAQAEYDSHVPFVKYNDNDEAGGVPFGLKGKTIGTSLDDESMVSYTLGGRVSIPFYRIE